MKMTNKIISMILSIAMLFSIASGIGVSAFAGDVNENRYVKAEYITNQSIPLKYAEKNERNGWYTSDNNLNKMFFYSTYFFKDGDQLVLTKPDGTKDCYFAVKSKLVYDKWQSYDFRKVDGESLGHIFVSEDEQYKNPWGLGEHTFRIVIDDYNLTVEVPVIISEAISAADRFSDLSGFDVYNDYVLYTSVYNEFLKGTNPPYFTEFSPKLSITRAMFVTILYRMVGEPYKDNIKYKESPFTDIKDTSVYYYDAACWALDKGITTQTTFKPYDNVTREQTASFLFRYAQESGKLGDDAYKKVSLSAYPDSVNIHSWAEESMKWANYNGMITGTQQGYANPQGSTLRIHATKILYGFGETCSLGNFS